VRALYARNWNEALGRRDRLAQTVERAGSAAVASDFASGHPSR